MVFIHYQLKIHTSQTDKLPSTKDQDSLDFFIYYIQEEKFIEAWADSKHMSKKVKVSVLPQIDTGMPEELDVEIDGESSTVSEVLTKFCKALGMKTQRYDEFLKKQVSVFWTRLAVKNGKVVGRFSMDGDIKDAEDLTVKPGDELAVYGPAEGG